MFTGAGAIIKAAINGPTNVPVQENTSDFSDSDSWEDEDSGNECDDGKETDIHEYEQSIPVSGLVTGPWLQIRKLASVLQLTIPEELSPGCFLTRKDFSDCHDPGTLCVLRINRNTSDYLSTGGLECVSRIKTRQILDENDWSELDSFLEHLTHTYAANIHLLEKMRVIRTTLTESIIKWNAVTTEGFDEASPEVIKELALEAIVGREFYQSQSRELEIQLTRTQDMLNKSQVETNDLLVQNAESQSALCELLGNRHATQYIILPTTIRTEVIEAHVITREITTYCECQQPDLRGDSGPEANLDAKNQEHAEQLESANEEIRTLKYELSALKSKLETSEGQCHNYEQSYALLLKTMETSKVSVSHGESASLGDPGAVSSINHPQNHTITEKQIAKDTTEMENAQLKLTITNMRSELQKFQQKLQQLENENGALSRELGLRETLKLAYKSRLDGLVESIGRISFE